MSQDTMTDAPTSTPAVRKPTRIDGRRLRSERTKQLIVEAYLLLLREGNRNPTAAQTAERAGYSVRSVFERFPDLHALRLAATDYAISEGRAQDAVRTSRPIARRASDPRSKRGRGRASGGCRCGACSMPIRTSPPRSASGSVRSGS